jgi:hypothetical protein
MYTIDALIRHAAAEGVSVTRRQIEEWNRDGLLPPATRPSVAGKPGRGPHLFPDPAPAAVLWLAQWRRRIGTPAIARGWLWLEGYDYSGYDPPTQLPVLVRAAHDDASGTHGSADRRRAAGAAGTVGAGGVAGAQDSNTSLARWIGRVAASTTPLADAEYEDIKDAIAARVVTPMLRTAHASRAEAYAASVLMAAQLGLSDFLSFWAVNEGLISNQSDVSGRASDTDATHLLDSPLIQAVMTAQGVGSFDALRNAARDQPAIAPDALLDGLSLAGIKTRPWEWDTMRLLWRVGAVMAAAPCPDAHPLLTVLAQVVRDLWRGAIGPRAWDLLSTLLTLKIACRLVPAGYIRRVAAEILALYGSAARP